MTQDDDAQILARALRIHGTDAQLDLLAEKCCELAASISQLRRKRLGPSDAVLERMADVAILLEQMHGPFGVELREFRERKVAEVAARAGVLLGESSRREARGG